MTQHNMQDYERACTTFEWKRPAHFNFAQDVIDQWAGKDPNKLAMHWLDDHGTEQKLTFADISLASRKLCNALQDVGISKGDTIIVMLPRNVEWWVTFTACLRMGAVISPGTTQLSPKDLEYRINAADAAGIITDIHNAAKVDEVLANCPGLKAKLVLGGDRDGWLNYTNAVARAKEEFGTVDTDCDDDAICYFTSGTTGYPKMCIHTHSYPIGHQATGEFWLDLREDDLHWNISDTGWAKAAWSSYFGPWICGAAIFVHHTSRFNTAKTLELLQQYPITTMCGAPTIYRMLVQEDLSQYSFDSLRHCVAAGEPLNPEIIDTWKKATDIVIRDGYGQTETTLLCGSFPCIEPRYGSMGKPSPGIDLKVIDHDGNVLPPHHEGDIGIRIKPEPPQGLFKQYKNNPEKTAETFKGDWYVTGDRAYTDADGYFWFVSRADDVILSAGYRIGPFEVESALIEHPAVAESAVVSSPDETRGEVVKAFIVLAKTHEPSETLKKDIQEHVKRVTTPYKYPRKIEFVDTLPKTVSGKIRRVELREREWQSIR